MGELLQEEEAWAEVLLFRLGKVPEPAMPRSKLGIDKVGEAGVGVVVVVMVVAV